MTVTLETVREMCLTLPGVTEDVKWGQDLCFCVGGKMFVVVNLEPPHQMSFKCTPDVFAELVEREGIIPAPYLARAMWIQERQIGEVLDRRELEPLLRLSYELVLSTLPKSRRPGAEPDGRARPRGRVKPARRVKRARSKPKAGRSSKRR